MPISEHHHNLTCVSLHQISSDARDAAENVGLQWDNQHQVSSWLAKNNVKFDKLKRIPHTTAAQLRFETKEERDAAMEHLKTAMYKGTTRISHMHTIEATTATEISRISQSFHP